MFLHEHCTVHTHSLEHYQQGSFRNTCYIIVWSPINEINCTLYTKYVSNDCIWKLQSYLKCRNMTVKIRTDHSTNVDSLMPVYLIMRKITAEMIINAYMINSRLLRSQNEFKFSWTKNKSKSKCRLSFVIGMNSQNAE